MARTSRRCDLLPAAGLLVFIATLSSLPCQASRSLLGDTQDRSLLQLCVSCDPLQWNPLCTEDGVVMAANLGCLLCADLSGVGPLSNGYCTEGVDARSAEDLFPQPPGPCSPCQPENSFPVCFPNGTEAAADRSCAANCLGLEEGQFSELWCQDASESAPPGGPPAATDSCGCFDLNFPVCNSQGQAVAKNHCFAGCISLPAGSYSSKWCLSSPSQPGSGQPPPPQESKGCLCPLIFNPYCDTQGNVKASNLCEVECLGLETSPGSPSYVSRDLCF